MPRRAPTCGSDGGGIADAVVHVTVRVARGKPGAETWTDLPGGAAVALEKGGAAVDLPSSGATVMVCVSMGSVEMSTLPFSAATLLGSSRDLK
mmetsp:Transcript_8454/g.25211  ORF Transcript_8454/g.25211 Transcript_8454/m.25211 type:complete len:93 (-) Transcript_8454:16-294(-)